MCFQIATLYCMIAEVLHTPALISLHCIAAQCVGGFHLELCKGRGGTRGSVVHLPRFCSAMLLRWYPLTNVGASSIAFCPSSNASSNCELKGARERTQWTTRTHRPLKIVKRPYGHHHGLPEIGHVCACLCPCVCVCARAIVPFLPGLPGWTRIGHTGVLGSGRLPQHSRPTVQARGVRAPLCYPSTSAICTWARTWLAAPGPPWKWGGGSVASAGPAPRH